MHDDAKPRFANAIRTVKIAVGLFGIPIAIVAAVVVGAISNDPGYDSSKTWYCVDKTLMKINNSDTLDVQIEGWQRIDCDHLRYGDYMIVQATDSQPCPPKAKRIDNASPAVVCGLLDNGPQVPRPD